MRCCAAGRHRQVHGLARQRQHVVAAGQQLFGRGAAQLVQQREAQEHDVTVAIQAVDEAANRIESVARLLMNGRKD